MTRYSKGSAGPVMSEPERGQPGTPAWFGWFDPANGELDHRATLATSPANDQDAAR